MRLFVCALGMLLALVALVQAADPNPNVVPSCAKTCMQAALQSNTSCLATNTTCLCNDKAYNEAVTACVSASCTVKEGLVTKRLSSRQCGIPIKPRSRTMIITRWVFMAVTTFFIGIRLWVKFGKFGGNWWWDDWTIILAYFIAVGFFVDNFYVVKYGLGTDMWDLSFYEITRWFWSFYIVALLYKFQMSLAKISVVFFFLRIFPSRNFRIYAIIVIVLNAIVGLLFTFLDAFQCMPINMAWKGWAKEDDMKCLDFPAQALANGIINIVLDVVMISLPIFEVTKLNLSLRKKISVCIMFGLGFMLTLTGILRSAEFSHHLKSTNPTLDMTPLHYWSLIECDLSVICACLPDTRAFLVHMFPTMFKSTTSGNTYFSDSKAFTGDRIGGGAQSRNTRVNQNISMTTTYEVHYSAKPNAKDEGSFVQLVDMDRRSEGQASRES